MKGRFGTVRLFAGVALAAMAATAHAQQQDAPGGAASNSDAAPRPVGSPAVAGTPSAAVQRQEATPQDEALTGDIVVTATRRNERIQDVPVTVTAITNEQVQKLQLKTFSDIQVLSPGLSFRNEGSQGNVTSLRGVSSTVTTSAPAAVVIYVNEVPVNDLVAFTGLYDVGQIEVLRGPQGTLRGVAAPVGSITIGTRRPDLTEFGGTGIATYSNQRFNAQGAVNLPIINDRLALRFAGLYEHNDNGDLRNPVTGAKSRQNTKSGRVSLLANPIDPLTIFVAYQHLEQNTRDLTSVRGTGFIPIPGQPFPAGYNGPVIDGDAARDGVVVQEQASPRRLRTNTLTLNSKLDLGNEAALNYNFGYVKFSSFTGLNSGDTDTGNAVLNYSSGQLFDVDNRESNHELRIDSSGQNHKWWDYAFGVDYVKNSPVHVTEVGANGNLSNPTIANPPSGPTTLSGNDIFLPETNITKSAFASSTFHLPTHTDITLGARRLQFKRDQGFILYQTTNGVHNTAAPLLNVPSSRKFNKWVFDAKLVQHLDRDKIVYFSYGRGFRGPGANRGVPIPIIPALQDLPAETSNSYELGFKGDFFNRRLRFNADVFQQDFKGFNGVAGDVPYCPSYGTRASGFCPFLATDGQVVFAGDARVRGFEAELSGNITRQWTASANVAYAKGNFKNAQVPYRPDLNGDGIPDTDAQFGARGTTDIAFRSSNGPISQVPRWIFTVQSEYTQPLAGDAEAYLRGLFNFRGKREDVTQGQSYQAEPTLDMYLGTRNFLVEGLELTAFAKNILDTRRVTLRNAGDIFTRVGTNNIDTGYTRLNFMQRREFGISARFTFGSDGIGRR